MEQLPAVAAQVRPLGQVLTRTRPFMFFVFLVIAVVFILLAVLGVGAARKALK